MANCPNCSSTLPFIKVGLLSKFSNKLKCNKCGKVLEASTSSMQAIGGIGGGLGSVLIFWNKEIFGDRKASILIAIGSAIALITLLAVFQNRTVRFKVAKNQEDPLFRMGRHKTPRPPLPENPSRVEYLKFKYHYKTDEALELIANASDKERTEEAREAAKQLISERKAASTSN